MSEIEQLLRDTFQGTDQYLAEDDWQTIEYQIHRVRETLVLKQGNSEQELAQLVAKSPLFSRRARAGAEEWEPSKESFEHFENRRAGTSLACWISEKTKTQAESERIEWILQRVFQSK